MDSRECDRLRLEAEEFRAKFSSIGPPNAGEIDHQGIAAVSKREQKTQLQPYAHTHPALNGTAAQGQMGHVPVAVCLVP